MPVGRKLPHHCPDCGGQLSHYLIYPHPELHSYYACERDHRWRIIEASPVTFAPADQVKRQAVGLPITSPDQRPSMY